MSLLLHYKNTYNQDLKNVLYESIGLLEEEYDMNSLLERDLGITEIGINLIADRAEIKFNIDIGDHEFTGIKTIKDIYVIIKKKLKGKK